MAQVQQSLPYLKHPSMKKSQFIDVEAWDKYNMFPIRSGHISHKYKHYMKIGNILLQIPFWELFFARFQIFFLLGKH
jgi:hypothetical protein